MSLKPTISVKEQKRMRIAAQAFGLIQDEENRLVTELQKSWLRGWEERERAWAREHRLAAQARSSTKKVPR